MAGDGKPRVKALSIDASADLDNPFFWANHLITFGASDTCPTLHIDLLGVTDEEASIHYAATLEPRLKEGRPALSFLAALDHRRSISIDFTPEPDPEVQLWLLDAEHGKSACIGIDSGDFELPALRPAELRWLMSNLGDAHPGYGLLLAPMCYFERGQDAPLELIERCAASLPGAKPQHARAAALSMIERNTIPEAAVWLKDEARGWRGTFLHSPRNPDTPPFYGLDFAFVAEFFNETADVA